MTIHPRKQADLMLAPVAAEIDGNLQRLRERPIQGIGFELALELNTQATNIGRDERTALVLRQALRDVDMHGWQAVITDDGSSVRLDGGSVSLDIGLGSNVTAYIREGVQS